jgi:hypothetical protein
MVNERYLYTVSAVQPIHTLALHNFNPSAVLGGNYNHRNPPIRILKPVIASAAKRFTPRKRLVEVDCLPAATGSQ